MNYKTIHDRYMKNYITDEQLERFVKLGVITEKQREELYAEKHPEENKPIVDERNPELNGTNSDEI